MRTQIAEEEFGRFLEATPELAHAVRTDPYARATATRLELLLERVERACQAEGLSPEKARRLIRRALFDDPDEGAHVRWRDRELARQRWVDDEGERMKARLREQFGCMPTPDNLVD